MPVGVVLCLVGRYGSFVGPSAATQPADEYDECDDQEHHEGAHHDAQDEKRRCDLKDGAYERFTIRYTRYTLLQTLTRMAPLTPATRFSLPPQPKSKEKIKE